MKKTLLSLFSLSIVLITTNVVLTSSSGGRANAANSGNTGAPSETQTCRSCHGSGFGTTVSITITDTSGSTVTSYNPGDTLEVEVEVNTTSTPSRYGFQIVSLNSINNGVNDWVLPSSNTRIASVTRSGKTRTYAEHNGKSTTSTFSSKWVAPSTGTGTVTFYAGGAAVNNNGSTSGDGGNTTSTTLTENVTTSLSELPKQANASVFPNPAVDIVNIQFEQELASMTTIEIRDLTGKLVHSSLAPASPSIAINVQDFQKGLYFLSIKEDEKLLYQTKFVKQ